MWYHQQSTVVFCLLLFGWRANDLKGDMRLQEQPAVNPTLAGIVCMAYVGPWIQSTSSHTASSAENIDFRSNVATGICEHAPGVAVGSMA
jgi:hypothetical protein